MEAVRKELIAEVIYWTRPMNSSILLMQSRMFLRDQTLSNSTKMSKSLSSFASPLTKEPKIAISFTPYFSFNSFYALLVFFDIFYGFHFLL